MLILLIIRVTIKVRKNTGMEDSILIQLQVLKIASLLLLVSMIVCLVLAHRDAGTF